MLSRGTLVDRVKKDAVAGIDTRRPAVVDPRIDSLMQLDLPDAAQPAAHPPTQRSLAGGP